jgi:hypothetical protein
VEQKWNGVISQKQAPYNTLLTIDSLRPFKALVVGSSFFGTGRKWLALTAVGLNTMALIANFAAPAPAIRQAVAIR